VKLLGYVSTKYGERAISDVVAVSVREGAAQVKALSRPSDPSPSPQDINTYASWTSAEAQFNGKSSKVGALDGIFLSSSISSSDDMPYSKQAVMIHSLPKATARPFRPSSRPFSPKIKLERSGSQIWT
jgi:hypothetical protein